MAFSRFTLQRKRGGEVFVDLIPDLRWKAEEANCVRFDFGPGMVTYHACHGRWLEVDFSGSSRMVVEVKIREVG